jgi:crotonobetainyl-CoA:carnitine CoA-transferase CaiB-like acyl-CoA transferase
VLVQAMSGALHSSGRLGEAPQPGPYFVADAITAYSAFEGALAGLLHRERTGEGQLIQVNMLDAIIAMQMQELSVRTVGGVIQQHGPEIHGHTYIRAPYGVFPTSDGYLALAFADLAVLADVFGDEQLSEWDAERDGFTHRDEISRRVAAHLATGSSQHWLTLLSERGVWVGPVYSYDDLLTDPQVAHNQSFVSYDHPTEGRVTTPGFAFRMSRTPATVTRPAPTAGQHTVDILESLGVPAERIDELLALKVLA